MACTMASVRTQAALALATELKGGLPDPWDCA
jgi:hypothetical protein